MNEAGPDERGDEPVHLPLRHASASARHVVAGDSGTVDREPGHIRGGQVLQARGQEVDIQCPVRQRREGPAIVQLDVEAAGEHPVQVLKQSADLCDRAIGCEGDQVAVRTELPAAIDQHLRSQRGDGILDVYLVVVDRQPHALERTCSITAKP